MSITSILKGNEFNEFKAFIRENIPKKQDFVSNISFKPFDNSVDIVVPGNFISRVQATLIGSLSDYIFCLEIARHAKKSTDQIYKVLNARAIQMFNGCINVSLLDEKCSIAQKKAFERALETTRDYAYEKNVSMSKLVQASYIIYKAENYLHFINFATRKEFLDEFLTPCDDIIIEEIEQLHSTFIDKFINIGLIKQDSEVVCHLWFEPWSSRCGGAIADVCIDGIIYDFKTTKRRGYNWVDIGQVYAYYILSCLCNEDINRNEKFSPPYNYYRDIKGIALYYSRYGDIETCNFENNNVLISSENLLYVRKIIHDHNEERFKKIDEKFTELFKDNSETLKLIRQSDPDLSEYGI